MKCSFTGILTNLPKKSGHNQIKQTEQKPDNNFENLGPMFFKRVFLLQSKVN